MQRIACLATLASLFTLAPAAHAQPQVAVEATPAPPPGDRRTEIDLGYLVGGGGIGTRDRFQRGVSVALGRRFGDLALLGEYDYLAIGRAEATGSESRFGLALRYSLLRTHGTPDEHGERSPMSGDMWIEGGAGYERIAWDAGGTLRRPDVVLGFGAQLDGVFRRASDEPSWFGPFVAFRAVLARGPETADEGDATCGGPCDAPGRPSPNDVALFFHFGVNWGR
jgi:hypothetical protein